MRDNTTATLQAIYDAERNFELKCFWDAGFEWKVGDDMNGYTADGVALTVDEAVQAIAKACGVEP